MVCRPQGSAVVANLLRLGQASSEGRSLQSHDKLGFSGRSHCRAGFRIYGSGRPPSGRSACSAALYLRFDLYGLSAGPDAFFHHCCGP